MRVNGDPAFEAVVFALDSQKPKKDVKKGRRIRITYVVAVALWQYLNVWELFFQQLFHYVKPQPDPLMLQRGNEDL